MTAPASPLLTPAEAAAYLRRGERWLRRHRAELGVVRAGGKPLYPIAALDDYIARNQEQPAAEQREPTRLHPAIDVRALGPVNRVTGERWR